MNRLPILDIEQFQIPDDPERFYANNFAKHLEKNHASITTPHKHNFYLAVLFTKGRGTHEIDFESYPIRPGSVFLLNPGLTHNWAFTEPVDGYIFFHTQSFYEATYTNRNLNNFPFYFSPQNSPHIFLENTEFTVIKNYFISVLKTYKSNHLMKQQRLCSLIDLIYIDLTQMSLKKDMSTIIQSRNYALKLHQLEQLIEDNYLSEKSPKAYARMMNITTKHLNRITRSMLEKTTSDLILERVTLEARRLLIYSTNNFTEIARSLGYEDYAYFSRLFKNKSGYSPSAFQKKYIR